jgi:hypothetical protein
MFECPVVRRRKADSLNIGVKRDNGTGAKRCPEKKNAGPGEGPGKYRRRAANLPEGNS